MTRTLILESVDRVGETVLIQGWVRVVRDHGKIAFLDVRDRTGVVQIVCGPEAKDLHPEDVVSITGQVKLRPEKLINPNLPTGKIEILAEKIEIISQAAELPFDMGKDKLDLQLPTLLDYRSLTLRHPSVSPIFKTQEMLAENFRQAARSLGCVEVFPPTISASSTEGGTEVLPVDYFGHQAFLVQSPQLYKQMMVGVFERVFIVTHIYRAEPSVTTRHLVESIQLDCEIGFIQDFSELLDALENVFMKTINANFKVPRLTMRQAQQIIFERTGVDHRSELDLMPEDEREIAKWAIEKYDSELVTITHYPTKKRSFYSLPDPKDLEYCLSYDLIYRGLEISSGSQRIHDYDRLVQAIEDRGMNPKSFEMYLQAFKYGMPPHGGFSFGLERTTMKYLNLDNIREASLYPRDMERVDFRL